MLESVEMEGDKGMQKVEEGEGTKEEKKEQNIIQRRRAQKG